MHIHREGQNTILLLLLLLAAAIIVPSLLVLPGIIRILIFLPIFLLFCLIIWFFRVPQRIAGKGINKVIAPADGRIVVIEKTIEPEYFKDERIQVSIFMSPLDVHQNVYPISGEVIYLKYDKGKYLVAWHPKSSLLNERSTIVIKHVNGTEILVRQIAGAVARRICTYSKMGENVEQSAELGFIKFGSRVDVFLPPGAKIACKVNDISKGRQTVLAEI